MKAVAEVLLLLYSGCCLADSNDEFAHNSTVNNGIISITTSSKYGGAISSVIFDNKEFVNNYDHGRQIQIAWSINNLGEALNPTEAGNQHDHSTSSSILRSMSVSGSTIRTISAPAYWLLPGDKTQKGNRTTYTSVLTNNLIEKTITLGYKQDPNLVYFQIVVTIPNSADQIQFEVPTGYLVNDFTKHYTFDPEDRVLKDVSRVLPPNTQAIKGYLNPIILATEDGSFAMGIWVEDLKDFSGYGESPFYSFSPINQTNKWSIVYRKHAITQGQYSFNAYMSIGDLLTVEKSIANIYSITKVKWFKLFDASCYLKSNPDVAKVYPSAEAARWHWTNVGINENRKSTGCN